MAYNCKGEINTPYNTKTCERFIYPEETFVVVEPDGKWQGPLCGRCADRLVGDEPAFRVVTWAEHGKASDDPLSWLTEGEPVPSLEALGYGQGPTIEEELAAVGLKPSTHGRDV